MKSSFFLCTGGTRSGKSEFAERLAMTLPGRHVYVATARVDDEEMQQRVALHVKRRPAAWQTVEMTSWLAPTVRLLWQTADVVLVDCITLYLANVWGTHPDDELETYILADIKQLLADFFSYDHKSLIMVTNELGSGIVPADAMTRLYRDIAGKVNQYLAQQAQSVYFSVSGITMEIKQQQVVLKESL